MSRKEKSIWALLWLSLVIFTIGIFVSWQHSRDQYRKMFKQCITDGYRDYQCHGMLNVYR